MRRPGSEGALHQTWSSSTASGPPGPTEGGDEALPDGVRAAPQTEHSPAVSGAAGKKPAKEVKSSMAAESGALRARGRHSGLTGWALSGELQQQQGAVNFEESVFSASPRANHFAVFPATGGTRETASQTSGVHGSGQAHKQTSPQKRSRVERVVSAIDDGRTLLSPSLQLGEGSPPVVSEPSAASQPSRAASSESVTYREPSTQEGGAPDGAAASNLQGGSGVGQEAQDALANSSKAAALTRLPTEFRSNLQRTSLVNTRYAIAQAMLQQKLEAAEVEE